jgi:hypothetical protein
VTYTASSGRQAVRLTSMQGVLSDEAIRSLLRALLDALP